MAEERLPNQIKDVEAYNNEFINHAVINRGRIRLFQNDEYLRNKINALWGSNVDENFRLVRTADGKSYEFKKVNGTNVMGGTPGDVIAYGLNADGEPRWGLHKQTTNMQEILDVDVDESKFKEGSTNALVYDTAKKKWLPKSVIINYDTFSVRVIDFVHTADRSQLIYLPKPTNIGDRVTIVKPSKEDKAADPTIAPLDGNPIKLIIRLETPPADQNQLEQKTNPTLMRKKHDEIQIYCEDTDRDFSTITLVASGVDITYSLDNKKTLQKATVYNWVPSEGSGNWIYEAVTRREGGGNAADKNDTYSVVKLSASDLSTSGTLTLLGDTPPTLGVKNQTLVSDPENGTTVWKNLNHKFADADYHSDILVPNDKMGHGDVLVFNPSLREGEGAWTNHKMQLLNTVSLNVPVGTIITKYIQGAGRKITYPGSSEVDPNWMHCDGTAVPALQYPPLEGILPKSGVDDSEVYTLPTVPSVGNIHSFIKVSADATYREVRDSLYAPLKTPIELNHTLDAATVTQLTDGSISPDTEFLFGAAYDGFVASDIRAIYIEVSYNAPINLDVIRFDMRYPSETKFTPLFFKKAGDNSTFIHNVVRIPVNELQDRFEFKLGGSNLVNKAIPNLSVKVKAVECVKDVADSPDIETIYIKGTVASKQSTGGNTKLFDINNQFYVDKDAGVLTDSSTDEKFQICTNINNKISFNSTWEQLFDQLVVDDATVTKTVIEGDFHYSGLQSTTVQDNSSVQEDSTKLSLTIDWRKGEMFGTYDVNKGSSIVSLNSGVIYGSRAFEGDKFVWKTNVKSSFGAPLSSLNNKPMIEINYRAGVTGSHPMITRLPKPGRADVVSYKITHYKANSAISSIERYDDLYFNNIEDIIKHTYTKIVHTEGDYRYDCQSIPNTQLDSKNWRITRTTISTGTQMFPQLEGVPSSEFVFAVEDKSGKSLYNTYIFGNFK